MSGLGTVIVGGGQAAVEIAAGLRGAGYGEPITLVSAEDELPYQRPPLSKSLFDSGSGAAKLLRPSEFYRSNEIDLLLGACVTEVDRNASRVALADDRSIGFDRLALATGARARKLTLDGADLDGVAYLRTIADARRLHEELKRAEAIVIVGGGFIGLELSATLSSLDIPVTLLEAKSRLLEDAVAPEISRYLLRRHTGWGVDVHLDEGLAQVVGHGGRVRGLTTTRGRVVAADLVIVGIGAVPNDELIGDSGLTVQSGIIVDAFMRTSDHRIVAAGDCTMFPHWLTGSRLRIESVQNATDQARAAVQTLLGRPVPFRTVPWFWSDQRDIKLQMAGRSRGAEMYITRGDPQAGRFSVFSYRSGRLIGVDAVNCPVDYVVGRKLLAQGISPLPEQVRGYDCDLKQLLPA